MKSQTQLLILAVVLFLFIVLTMVYSCCSFKPYEGSSLFKNQTKFEAFESSIAKTSSSPSEIVPDLAKKEENEEDVKVEGFEGLKPTPFGDSKELDSFSKTKGSISCQENSSGLHNSLGGLCLSEEQIKLLGTRGGNASGGDAEVGAA